MASDEERLLLALLLKKKRRRVRKMRKKPMFASRLTEGVYYKLFADIIADERKFFSYLRMSKSSFYELLGCIEEDIKGINSTLNVCFPPEEKLVLTLRYLATGASMTDLQFQFRISQPSISVIIRQVCKAIRKNIEPTCFPELSERFWLETATEFYEKTNFPHCLGAVGAKHIKVVKPDPILLFAVSDASFKFVFVDVDAIGKSSDSTVFKESAFFRKLRNNKLNVPQPKGSFTGMTETMPFVFVADEGFGLSPHMLRPYGGKSLTVEKRVFNYRLTRARRSVDCAFGILTNKWRILQRPLNVDLTLCEEIIKVCCVLHNFVRDRDGFQIEDTLTIEGLFDVEYGKHVKSQPAMKLRDKFVNYFVSEEGALPWQMDRI